MTDKRILLVGAGDVLCDAALARNIDYLLAESPHRLKPDLLKSAPAALVIDYENDPAFVDTIKALHSAAPFDAVLTLTEPALLPVANLEHDLGLSSTNKKMVNLTKNKAEMRRCLAETGVDNLPFTTLKTQDDVREFLKECSGPIIVKPIAGQASTGVTKIEVEADIECLDFSNPEVTFIAEVFLDGPEYSVETFSFNGHHIVLSITEKILAGANAHNPFVELGHVMPADLDETTADSIRRYTIACLDAIGLHNGPAHTEVKLTQDGPRIIETHNRVGGDQIVDLLLLSHEINVLDLTVAWPLDMIAPLDQNPDAKRAAAIQFFTPEPGVVSHVAGTFAARRMPDVVQLELNLSPGDVIRPIQESFDRPGYIICTGNTPQDARAACEAALSKIHIEIQ